MAWKQGKRIEGETGLDSISIPDPEALGPACAVRPAQGSDRYTPGSWNWEHGNLNGFWNPGEYVSRRGGFWHWQTRRMLRRLPRPPTAGYSNFSSTMLVQPDFNTQDRNALWWLGHATVLLRIAGRMVLTDPHLSRWAGPVPYLGPSRRVPMPVTVPALPAPELVLISHNHFDHLDRSTVRRLATTHPGTFFLVPLGLGPRLRHWGIHPVHELDWWESIQIAGLELTCVPARHWSRRTLLDYNHSLWCGWVVKTAEFCFYFSGDTAYSKHLTEVSTRLGTPDLAALPIGAYEPRDFMRRVHINPAEAVRLHRELGIGQSLAIHWGTFELSNESLDEPPRALAKALDQEALDRREFIVLQQGERHILG